MRHIIVVVDKVEDDTDYNGKAIKKVTDKGGNVWKVKWGQGGKLKDKWELLDENVGLAFDFTLDTYQGKEFVKDIELVKDAFVTKAAQEVAEKSPGKSPQEVGMFWKELGECIRSGQLEKDFPNMVVKIKGEYYKKMSEVTGINFKKEAN